MQERPVRAHSITNCPSFPNECCSAFSAGSHSSVHSFEPSDHGPVHSESPHGLRSTTKRLPLYSTARRTEYAWPPMSPLTVRSVFPLRVLSSVSNPQPKSRSFVARSSSSVQKTSGSSMSWAKLLFIGSDIRDTYLSEDECGDTAA